MASPPPLPAPKPRRPYTVSAKILAANLAKARAVPKAIRYRDTPRAADRPSARGRLGPPTKAAISLLLRELRHFNPTEGIRCE